MSEFFVFFQLGFQHICSLQGADHVVFVLVLCAIYRLEEWKKIIVPVTGFTIGHSITLALSVLDKVHLPEALIETLIPVTILLTAIGNVIFYKKTFFSEKNFKTSNLIRGISSTFFGLIHGLGFSYYLKALLSEGTSIVTPLFAFNVGLEIGQFVIIACILGIYAIFTRYFKGEHRDWVVFVSGVGVGIALKILLE